jgi:hypothetical protein
MGLVLAGCASAPGGRADPAVIVDGLVGGYDNAAQWAQMGETFRASAGISPVSVRFVRAKAPTIGPAVIYEEWRSSDAQARPLRQRIWVLRPDAASVRAERFNLTQPARFFGAGGDAFLALTRADLAPMGVGCALTMALSDRQNWNAETRPGACRPEGQTPVNTRITRMPTGVLYAETRGGDDPATVAAPFDLRRKPGAR